VAFVWKSRIAMILRGIEKKEKEKMAIIE